MPDLSRYLEDRTLIMLSNREPYEHRHSETAEGTVEIEVRQPPGGLVSAAEASACHTSLRFQALTINCPW